MRGEVAAAGRRTASRRGRCGTALFLGAGELLMRQPGIVALHSLTTAQRPALRLPHHRRRRDSRQLLLLQAASFVPLFREAMK